MSTGGGEDAIAIEVDTLIQYQEDVSGRITKALNNFKKAPKERRTEEFAESRLDALELLWSQFTSGHADLLRKIPRKLLSEFDYVKFDLYDKTEDLYLNYKCLVKEMINSFSKLKQSGGKHEGTGSKSTQVKLSKINIPVFTGKYSEWNTRDLFTSLIHNRDDIESVQKLHYLKGYLSGEAEQLLRHIPVAEANYSRCWELLDQRYNNKKYICNNILKRLFGQLNLVSESSNGLKDLIDTTNDCLSALKSIDMDVASWDVIIIHILTSKLDPETRRQWEFSVTEISASDELPTYVQFKEFLTNRYRAMEFLPSENRFKGVKPHSQHNNQHPQVKPFHAINVKCLFCEEEHKIGTCKKFAKESVDSRRSFVLSNNICFCCLGSNHSAKFCQHNVKCRTCKGRHHTLLHPKGNSGGFSNGNSGANGEKPKGNSGGSSKGSSGANAETPHSDNGPSSSKNEEPIVSCVSTGKVFNLVLLATALVKTKKRNGEQFMIRALLDQGSQSSFVTEHTVQSLGLQKTPVNSKISGVGGDNGLVSKAMVNIVIMSRVDPKVVISVKAYVLKSITSLIPSCKIESMEWEQLTNMSLADPEYHTPSRIDVLLGTEVYSQVIQEGVRKGPLGSPIAQSTKLGWILSGVVNKSTKPPKEIKVMHSQVDDNNQLKRFWELEADAELPKEKLLTDDERRCEELFSQTTQRDEEGRYIVCLPFKDERPEVTNSMKIAEKGLYTLEKRLNNDCSLKKKYGEVIKDYVDLGHMEFVPQNEIDNPSAIYLPHHAVIREDKDTTKVRVVFDASCKGNNRKSLNDNLLVGSTLQPDLRHIIMRWRASPICLVADIVKMYRQIKVANTDTDFQRILWRSDNESKIDHYRMLRVTFGVASAPYLAVKSLQQVAIDKGREYPMAADRVLTEFYMDDLLTGVQTIEEGIKLYEEMNKLLRKAGFELQKWTSSDEELVKAMKESELKGKSESEEKGSLKDGIKIKEDEIMKIVGLTWKRNEDSFRYTVDLPNLNYSVITKRKIISDISRFYDPLGWVGPCIIIPKILIQKLWLAGLDWDETVPRAILNEWLTYRQELKMLESISIPRWTGTRIGVRVVELHGFSDASKVAYAAVVYLRVINSKDEVRVSLISSKTKVAPVKQVSIPRLELCGAVLLTKLMIEIATIFKVDKSHLHAWTDSTVVLVWLNSHPNRWKVFVANRVSEILTHLDSHNWSHVTSKQNPADSASRGLRPSELINDQMWFRGPEFLHSKCIDYQRPRDLITNLEETKSFHVTAEKPLWDRFSSLTRMIRVIAYCRRFFQNCRNKDKMGSFLTTQELKEALNIAIKQSQMENFDDDINKIKKKDILPKSSCLRSLNPYFDGDGVLRVGGRLTHSQLDENRKHPILMPKRSYVTDLIEADAHKQTLHGGPQLMLCYIQSKYWILGAKQLVRACFRKCVTCTKNTGVTQTQLMGQLPSARVTPMRAFKNSGVDYAGPIQIRTAKGRGHKSHKGYICLFVCMATRAIHLEIVSDLTAEGSIQAFKRFVARRGYCSDIWSDNATNFTGAASELKKLFLAEKKSMLDDVAEILATNVCNRHFIPSRSPNFGGLWEAGVKSVKHHLKRVIGQSTLTFEEMSTVLAQVEACLNSRPLSALPCDENDDVSVLTPGHFLVGEQLLSPPERNYESANVSSLRRWQLTQRMLQDFWRRWSQEYLTKFYHRYKWSSQCPQPKIGDVVVVKEDGLPVCRWMYGRVIDVHPGEKTVLHNVSGEFRSGELTCILGPSGAGKSTLLNILAGYVSNGVNGRITVNGHARDMRVFKKLSSYIMQDDLLQPRLTVVESMRIAADLKLGTELGRAEKELIIEEILQTLGLWDHRETRSEFLSGGQSKRLSVALELVNNPPIIFLDEPTTGLDVVSIRQLVVLLRLLSRQGRTIICTIHQPSASLFSLFDRVYVLARGMCCYQGASPLLVPFLTELGHICPKTHNPADFVLETILGDVEAAAQMSELCQNGKLCRKLDRITARGGRRPVLHSDESIQRIFGEHVAKESLIKMEFATTFLTQFFILSKRMFVQTKRNSLSLWIQLIHHVVSAVLLGSIFFKVGNDGSMPIVNFKFCLSCVVFFMYTHIMIPILLFPMEVRLLRREYFNRWYSLKAYYAAMTFSTLPVMILHALLFLTICYTMSGQMLEWDRFALFCTSGIMTAICSEGLGLAVGSAFSATNGSIIGPATVAPLLALCCYGMGFGPYIEASMKALMSASYLRYGLSGFSLALYTNRPYMECLEPFCMYADPRILLRDIGMENDKYYMQIVGLLAFTTVHRVLAYMALRYRLTAEFSSKVMTRISKFLKHR